MEETIILNTVINWHDEKKDIICLRYLPEIKSSDDIESAKQIIQAIYPFSIPGKPQGFMVDAPEFYIEKEVLDFYQKIDYGEVARAIITPSFATKIMGNMFMKLTKNSANENGKLVPLKLFNSHEKAIVWLREQIAKHTETTE